MGSVVRYEFGMGRMTGESMIDYEALAQDAMRNVVRSVLIEAADKGLPGEHHFYISFDTLAPGVILSKRLREKYAEEMTVVLQHRFWDLIVSDTRFEVKLTFDGIPERLVVPFKAIRVFFDPSVRYGLQFEPMTSAPDPDSEQADDEGDEAFDDPFADRDFAEQGRPPVSLDREREASVPRVASSKSGPRSLGAHLGDRSSEDSDNTRSDDDDVATVDAPEHDEIAEDEGAKVVSLDAFRKK